MGGMNEKSNTAATPKGDRIAKVLARAGIASRRAAEGMVAEGRVRLNGKIITSPAVNVLPSDKILVDNKPLAAPDPPRLWRYHKPRGLVTTESDPQGRQTVFASLPDDLPRVLSVGRLDINTEGLLLLTNDGGLKRFLELPETGWLRRYRVRAYGRANEQKLLALKKGVTIDGITYRGVDITVERQQGDNVWLLVVLREGKNREVKKILEYVGLQVNRLIRLSFGPFQLGSLEDGKVEEVPRRVLRQQLGIAWTDLNEGRTPVPSAQKRTGRKPAQKTAPNQKDRNQPATEDKKNDNRKQLKTFRGKKADQPKKNISDSPRAGAQQPWAAKEKD